MEQWKLCGKDEPCFEIGDCWGHCRSTMCKHLCEKKCGSKLQSYCLKTEEFVRYYDSQATKDKLTNEEQNK